MPKRRVDEPGDGRETGELGRRSKRRPGDPREPDPGEVDPGDEQETWETGRRTRRQEMGGTSKRNAGRDQGVSRKFKETCKRPRGRAEDLGER